MPFLAGGGLRASLRNLTALLSVGDLPTRALDRVVEAFPSVGGRGVLGVVDGVVLFELALGLARHLAKDAHVGVAHDRARSGSGIGMATETAWGSSCGRSSGPSRRKPKLLSGLVS